MKTNQPRLETLCKTAGRPRPNPRGDIQISALGGFMDFIIFVSSNEVLRGSFLGKSLRKDKCLFSPVFAPSPISISVNGVPVHVSLVVCCWKV